MIALGLLTGMLVVSFAAACVMTYAMTRFLQVAGATWKRAVAVVLVISSIEVCALVVYVLARRWSFPNGLLEGVFLLFAALMPLAVYSRAYRVSGFRLAAFFGLQVAGGAVGLGMALLMRAYLAESFVVNANSMAPTIYGYRVEGVCPKCGGPAVKTIPSPEDPEFGRIDFGPEPCMRCGTPTQFSRILRDEILPPDRFLVEKLSKPERWDLVTFRNPQEPEQIYIKRLVGMPGETITIRDGFVHADERKLEPPAETGELRYLSNYDEFGLDYRDPSFPDLLWGDPRRPIRLGADEYFLLGDQTRRSLDGRFWGAVRRDALIGKASVVYWPPERWRFFE